jgi:hypothetical protein
MHRLSELLVERSTKPFSLQSQIDLEALKNAEEKVFAYQQCLRIAKITLLVTTPIWILSGFAIHPILSESAIATSFAASGMAGAAAIWNSISKDETETEISKVFKEICNREKLE